MLNTSTLSVPEAYLSTGKNRLKLYGGKNVYLRDDQEFEIELFNPTTSTVAAKIYLNGKAISESRIVVKPGERVFVERFLDAQKKFRFETYEVENSKAAKAAIADNGSVKVEFYTEYIPYTWFPTITTTPSWTTTVPYNPPYYTTCDSLSFFCSTDSTFGTTGTTTTCSNSYSTLTGSLGITPNSAIGGQAQKSIETGRVEAGSNSNQTFQNYSGQFNTYPSTTVEYKILPESAKPVDVKQLRQYCPGCRNRIRKTSWKFCPSCGESLD